MIPSVGRIVHVVDGAGRVLAAVIASAYNDHTAQHFPCSEACHRVGLVIYDLSFERGCYTASNVPFSETYKQRHWSWPPVVARDIGVPTKFVEETQ